MKLQKIILLLLILMINYDSQAQEDGTADIWSLEKCINYAFQNSLQIQQADLAIAQAQLSQKQAVWAQFPTLNASFRHGANFGRSVDLTSYSFVNQVTHSSSLSLNLNQVIFQGFQIRNTIKQTKVDADAALKDSEQARNDVALQVAQAYLAILLAEESLGVLQEQAKVTTAQYEQTIKLITAGVLAENSKYDLEAQMARDEENIVVSENNIQLAYVNLKTLINLNITKAINIQKVENVDVDEETELATLDAVYQEAINNQPNIAAAKLRERSAQLGVQIAKGALYPSVSFYGGLTSNFSSAAKGFDGFNTSYDTLSGQVVSSQDPVFVESVSFSPIQGKVIPYFTQLGGNTAGNLGVNISIPIFNGMRTRIGIQRAELGVKSAQLATQQREVTLKANIDRSLTDVKAAAKRLKAAKKSVVATRMSVQNTRKRYDLGVVNSFELTSVQNTLSASESNLLQAKYDYLFKLKILDYYKGTPIKID